jgi:hypothetical protein
MEAYLEPKKSRIDCGIAGVGKTPGHTTLMVMLSFCKQSATVPVLWATDSFEDRGHSSCKGDDSSFGSAILWQRLDRVIATDASCSHDRTAWSWVLPHEVHCELCPVHNTFVIDIGRREIWLRRQAADISELYGSIANTHTLSCLDDLIYRSSFDR